MGTIKLSDGYSLLSAGYHQIKITAVEYKEEFGKLTLSMETEEGEKHTETYRLLKADGTTNGGAYSALASLARKALQDDNLDEFDPKDLVGHFFACEVVHESSPSTKNPGRTYTNIRFNDIAASDGWATAAPAPQKAPIDIMALLGRR